MSQSDFDFYANNDAGELFEGGSGTGSAILNASLSGPLGDGDTFCRRIGPNALNIVGDVYGSIGAAVDGGTFDAPDTTLGISLVCNMRFAGDERTDMAWSMGMACRYKHTPTGRTGEGFQGYGMRFGRLKNRAADVLSPLDPLHVAVWARTNDPGSGIHNEAENIVLLDPTTSGAWVKDQWYTFRFDCIPTGTLADEIKVYVRNGGDLPIVWTPIASMIVSRDVDAYYVASDAGQRVGFYYSQSDQNGGTSGHLPRPYIDNFKAYAELV